MTLFLDIAVAVTATYAATAALYLTNEALIRKATS